MDPEHDLSASSRVPSPIEIVGLIALVVPFVINTSSVQSTTVNGEVTSFVYRNWIAVGAGAAAAVCGLFSLLSIKRAMAAKRGLRIGLALLLLAGGAFQILRGFGIVGVDKPEVSHRPEMTMPTTLPTVDKPVANTLDPEKAVAASKAIINAFRDGKVAAIYDAAHPQFKESVDINDLQFIHDVMTESFGPLGEVGDLVATPADGSIVVAAPAKFEKGTLDLKLRFDEHEGQPLLANFDLKIPKDLQVEMDPAAADKYARTVVDGLLRGEFQREYYHPRLIANAPADFADKLKTLLATIGKIKKVGTPTVRECKESRCLTFAVVGAKKKAEVTIDMIYGARSLRVITFNITPL